jgi:hypothetical protein
MAKETKTTHQVFQDLDNYLNFCRAFGYKFDEADLYSQRSYAYRQYSKFASGKHARDMWAQDTRPN